MITYRKGWNFPEAANAYFEVVPVWVYLAACAAYYPAMRAGQRWMEKRPAYRLKYPLLAWNVFMSAVSFYAWVQIDIHLQPFRVDFPVCDQRVMNDPAAWFILVFNLTKPLEWVDTAFLVLRKRRVIFLHWFHHLATALYCLHATVYSAVSDTTGTQFAAMNLVVHGVMYGYYALTSVRRFSWTPMLALYVNTMQALQMLFGIAVIARSLMLCSRTWEENWHGMLLASAMYGVYLWMFGKMLWTRVSRRWKKKQ
jgi:elongation of very long chain fatty acids protein 6